jgi:hypothetical protein
MRYLMGSAVLMKKGGYVGYTFHNKGRFVMGLDAKTDICHGQYNIYAKPIVMGKELLVRAWDVFCKDYYGGNGTKVYDNLSPADYTQYMNGSAPKDIHLIPRWANFRMKQPYFDITGEYHPRLPANEFEKEGTKYEVVEEMVKRWQFKKMGNDWDPRSTNYKSRHQVRMSGSRMNTICHQAVQKEYSHRAGGGSWSKIVREAGHWGAQVGPGCRAARTGNGLYIPKQAYLDAAPAA